MLIFQDNKFWKWTINNYEKCKKVTVTLIIWYDDYGYLYSNFTNCSCVVPVKKLMKRFYINFFIKHESLFGLQYWPLGWETILTTLNLLYLRINEQLSHKLWHSNSWMFKKTFSQFFHLISLDPIFGHSIWQGVRVLTIKKMLARGLSLNNLK